MELGDKTSYYRLAEADIIAMDFMLDRLWNMGNDAVHTHSKSK